MIRLSLLRTYIPMRLLLLVVSSGWCFVSSFEHSQSLKSSLPSSSSSSSSSWRGSGNNYIGINYFVPAFTATTRTASSRSLLNNSRNDSTDNQSEDDDEDDNYLGLNSFQSELARRRRSDNGDTGDNVDDNYTSLSNEDAQVNTSNIGSEEDELEVSLFDGYDLRDIIYNKWGECFDVDFQRVDSYGFRNVYLNIMPFRLGGRRFRHQAEYDYLCHLQAVVEILMKYNQLDYILTQIQETTKKPRAGTSPLVAVPLRLDLTPEQVEKILR